MAPELGPPPTSYLDMVARRAGRAGVSAGVAGEDEARATGRHAAGSPVSGPETGHCDPPGAGEAASAFAAAGGAGSAPHADSLDHLATARARGPVPGDRRRWIPVFLMGLTGLMLGGFFAVLYFQLGGAAVPEARRNDAVAGRAASRPEPVTVVRKSLRPAAHDDGATAAAAPPLAIETRAVRVGAGQAVPLPVRVLPQDKATEFSIHITGAPERVRLTAGRKTAEGGWLVPAADLEATRILLPPDVSGRFRLAVDVVGGDGKPLPGLRRSLDLTVAESAAPPRRAARPTAPAALRADEAKPSPRQASLAGGSGGEATAQQPGAEEALKLIGKGETLMDKGDVAGARRLFEKSAGSGLPEAALALARSYDPAYLARIAGANAEPDAARARALYREWYRRSVARGELSPGMHLERLLQAMEGE